MKKRFLIVLIGLAQLSFQLKSQDTLLIDKIEFIQPVLENNAKIKIAESILRPLEVTRAFFINSLTILSPVLGYKLVQLFKRLGTE
ncbi:MAG: hypothetical protein ACI905_002129 [Roseivirga sp.]|jgi:hypothetical protein